MNMMQLDAVMETSAAVSCMPQKAPNVKGLYLQDEKSGYRTAILQL